MAVTYKDIDLLSQKSSVAGTEKLPVSDTQYITPDQIAAHKKVHLTDESDMPASPDSGTLYLIDDDGSGGSGGGVSDVTLGGTSVVSNGVAALPAYPTTLPASDVSSWAKEATKPTYTASEVGALPSSTSIPSKTSDLNNDSGFRKITISSSEPTSSDGSNGDIWIVI